MIFVLYFSLPTSRLMRNPEVQAKLAHGVEGAVKERDDRRTSSSPPHPPKNQVLYKALESKPFHRALKSKLKHDTTITVFFFRRLPPAFSPKELLLGIGCPAPVFACWGRGMPFVPHLQMAWMLLLFRGEHFPVGCIQKVLFIALVQTQVTKEY